AVAAGWLARAGRLLAPLDPGPDHGRLAFFEGYLAAGGGDEAGALARARAAAACGRRCGVPDLEMVGLGPEGAPPAAAARVAEGMPLLDEATAAALDGEAQRAAALDRDFLAFATAADRGAPAGPAEIPYEYLLVVARKR